MKSPTGLPRYLPIALLQVLFILSLTISAFTLAWHSLRVADFAYPMLYEIMSIDEHIAKWGPRNRFRDGFETTEREQHFAYFAAITEAVHNQGEGLESLRYRDGHGTPHPLLRHSEIIHLRSVARLIDILYMAGWIALGTMLLTGAALRAMKRPVPPLSRIFLWTGIATAGAAVITLFVGPTRVFYTAHHWVFPPGEQWYFTYPESLMTTMMKAPDLFGGIAVLLLAATLFYFGLLMAGAKRIIGQGVSG